MKITLFSQLIPLATATFTVFLTNLSVQAVNFEQQEVNQNQFIAIARPYAGNKYDLLILQQIPGKQQCWQENGNNPVLVNPLLLNFDFTGSCERSTDSNGYSIRLDNQDLGLDYLLRVAERNGELVLVGTNRRNDAPKEIVIGRTHGLSQGFMKFELDSGWRFAKRAYGGRILSHIYLSGDRTAINSSLATTKYQTLPINNIKPSTITNNPTLSTNNNQSLPSLNTTSSSKVVKELTFTAANNPITKPPLSSNQFNSQPSLNTVDRNVADASPKRTFANVPTPRLSNDHNSNLLPPPPPPKILRPSNTSNIPNTSNTDNLAPNFPNSYNTGANYSRPNTPFKVMAAVAGEDQQNQVRSLYPDAFATSYKGQRVLQVGVFSTQENAQQAYQSLQNAGLQAIMIP